LKVELMPMLIRLRDVRMGDVWGVSVSVSPSSTIACVIYRRNRMIVMVVLLVWIYEKVVIVMLIGARKESIWVQSRVGIKVRTYIRAVIGCHGKLTWKGIGIGIGRMNIDMTALHNGVEKTLSSLLQLQE